MLEIIVRCPDKNDADKANYNVCSIFQGLEAFKNDDIMVTPVDEIEDQYYFSIIFPDNNVDRKVYLEAGEFTLFGVKSVWGICEDSRNEKNLAEENSEN